MDLTLLGNQRICRCAVTQLPGAEFLGYFPDSVLNELPIKQYWSALAVNSAQRNMRVPVICVVVGDGDPFSLYAQIFLDPRHQIAR